MEVDRFVSQIRFFYNNTGMRIKHKYIILCNIIGVRLGEWDQQSNPDCESEYCAEPCIDIPVTERILHENYQPTRAHENDIALLRLERSVTFTNWIKPICLPIYTNVRNHIYESAAFTVAGWGKVSDSLLKIILSLLNLMYFLLFFQTEVLQRE